MPPVRWPQKERIVPLRCSAYPPLGYLIMGRKMKRIVSRAAFVPRVKMCNPMPKAYTRFRRPVKSPLQLLCERGIFLRAAPGIPHHVVRTVGAEQAKVHAGKVHALGLWGFEHAHVA